MDDSDDTIKLAHLRQVAKRELRTRLRAVRAVLPQEARQTRSAAAVARVLELPEFGRAQTILGFSAIQKELDPAALLQHAREQGKCVALPRVVEDRLELHAVASVSELEAGAFGVLEPSASAPRVAAHEVELAIVPGLAFDARGHRIGYGRAFYDRLLPALTRAFTVGMAYDFQLLVELPNDPHDIPVHCVVSDARCLRV